MNHRYINAGRGWDGQSAGEHVCKYGKTTRCDCGEIETKYYQLAPHRRIRRVLVRMLMATVPTWSSLGIAGSRFLTATLASGY